MKSNILSRGVAVLMIGAVSLVGTSGFANTRAVTQEPAQTDVVKPVKKQNAPKAAKSAKKTANPQQKPRAATKAPLDTDVTVEPQRKPRAATKAPLDTNVTVEPQRKPRATKKAPLDTEVTVEPQRKPRGAVDPQTTPRVANKPARLPRERQDQLIVEQRERSAQYHQRLHDQEQLAQQRSQALRQERRMAQYRYQQQYYELLRRQRLAIENANYYNYDRDPYYYTAANYRYYRGGTYYQTNRYGADLVRQAVNYGYEQGYRAGDADRQDRWNNGFEDGFAYQDANYGYGGRYVDQDTYNYYFREGYRRGYYDGYNRRYDYGHRSNTALVVLASVLAGIVVFEAINDDN